MRVTILGATGRVGKAATAAAVAAGHEVTILSRRSDPGIVGVTVVVGALDDPTAVRAALAGAGGVGRGRTPRRTRQRSRPGCGR
jgi:uncharacterized protein YbjT (DUF2867 family)